MITEVEIKLKPKEWFEKNAYCDGDGDYWETEYVFSEWERTSSSDPGIKNLTTFIKGIYLEDYSGSGYMNADVKILHRYMWGCDEDFILQHPQYFI